MWMRTMQRLYIHRRANMKACEQTIDRFQLNDEKFEPVNK